MDTPPRPNESQSEYVGYCHHCDSEKHIKIGVYTCPTCNSEFVEILDVEDSPISPTNSPISPTNSPISPTNSPIPEENVLMHNQLMEAHYLLSHALEDSLVQEGIITDSDRQSSEPNNIRAPMLHQINRLLNNLMQHPIPTLQSATTNSQLYLPNNFNTTSQALPFQMSPIHFEDWNGRMEQLIQNLDGVPPLSENRIRDMTTSLVSQGHLDKNLQCSICWEDFVIDETIIKLVCDHIFHKDCIVPWLGLHATCPVCRKCLGNGIRRTNSISRTNMIIDGYRAHDGATYANRDSIIRFDIRNGRIVPSFTTPGIRTPEVPSTISSSNLQTHGTQAHVTREPIPLFSPATNAVGSEVPPTIDLSPIHASLERLQNGLVQVHETLVSRSSPFHSLTSPAMAHETVSHILPSLSFQSVSGDGFDVFGRDNEAFVSDDNSHMVADDEQLNETNNRSFPSGGSDEDMDVEII